MSINPLSCKIFSSLTAHLILCYYDSLLTIETFMLNYYYNLFLSCCRTPSPSTVLVNNTPLAELDLDTIVYPATDVNQAFSYENMNDICVQQRREITCDGYRGFYEPFMAQEFVFIQNDRDNDATQTLQRSRKDGWKLHILVADPQNSNNLERGWLIVKDQLIKHNIYLTKIITQDNREILRADTEQMNKTITVYSFKQEKSAQEWQQFFYDTTIALRDAQIQHGSLPMLDSQIQGSHYFSYRNSKNNPTPDPFAGIDASVNPGLTNRTSRKLFCC